MYRNEYNDLIKNPTIKKEHPNLQVLIFFNVLCQQKIASESPHENFSSKKFHQKKKKNFLPPDFF